MTLLKSHERNYIMNREQDIVSRPSFYVIGDYPQGEFGISTITENGDFLVDPSYKETEGTKACYVWEL